MTAKTPTLTYEQALAEYFGGLAVIAKLPLPFKCKCGAGVYTLPDTWTHIRQAHKERIKK